LLSLLHLQRFAPVHQHPPPWNRSSCRPDGRFQSRRSVSVRAKEQLSVFNPLLYPARRCVLLKRLITDSSGRRNLIKRIMMICIPRNIICVIGYHEFVD
jgi:hypothetical protein